MKNITKITHNESVIKRSKNVSNTKDMLSFTNSRAKSDGFLLRLSSLPSRLQNTHYKCHKLPILRLEGNHEGTTIQMQTDSTHRLCYKKKKKTNRGIKISIPLSYLESIANDKILHEISNIIIECNNYNRIATMISMNRI